MGTPPFTDTSRSTRSASVAFGPATPPEADFGIHQEVHFRQEVLERLERLVRLTLGDIPEGALPRTEEELVEEYFGPADTE